MKKVRFSLLLPENIDAKIRRLAEDSGRTRSAYVRQILRRYIKYMETKDTPEGVDVDWEIK